jgi:hypothetical protein
VGCQRSFVLGLRRTEEISAQLRVLTGDRFRLRIKANARSPDSGVNTLAPVAACALTDSLRQFTGANAAYAQNADGWPRILSRLKTLLETGKTFRPHTVLALAPREPTRSNVASRYLGDRS